MLANIFLVVDGERKNILKINPVVHVVDIKPEIISIKLNRVEVARVNLVSRQGFISWITPLKSAQIINRRADVIFENRLRRLMRDRDLIPLQVVRHEHDMPPRNFAGRAVQSRSDFQNLSWSGLWSRYAQCRRDKPWLYSIAQMPFCLTVVAGG